MSALWQVAASAVYVVLGHCLVGCVVYLRLVHVVPHTVNALSEEVFVQSCPPFLCFRVGEVGECGCSRPCVAVEILAFCGLHPDVVFGSRFVNEVVGIYFCARINHPCGVESTQMEVAVYGFRVRELFGTERENAVAVHVVDIHPDGITRYALVSECVGHLDDTAVRLIGEAALMISKGPTRYHRRGACELSQSANDSLRRLSVDDKHSERYTLAAQFNLVVGAAEDGFPCRVEQDTERRAVFSHTHHPRMRLIQACSVVHTVCS